MWAGVGRRIYDPADPDYRSRNWTVANPDSVSSTTSETKPEIAVADDPVPTQFDARSRRLDD